jgi:hypothetical protein
LFCYRKEVVLHGVDMDGVMTSNDDDGGNLVHDEKGVIYTYLTHEQHQEASEQQQQQQQYVTLKHGKTQQD